MSKLASGWRVASMWDAVGFMTATDYEGSLVRIGVSHIVVNGPDGSGHAYGVEFDDGSKVVCESRWSGPYSELTPDIDARSPDFFIYEPTGLKQVTT